jgi:hypothetical protein
MLIDALFLVTKCITTRAVHTEATSCALTFPTAAALAKFFDKNMKYP